MHSPDHLSTLQYNKLPEGDAIPSFHVWLSLMARERPIERISYREADVDLLWVECNERSQRLSFKQAKRWFEGSCPENMPIMDPLPGFYDGLKAV